MPHHLQINQRREWVYCRHTRGEIETGWRARERERAGVRWSTQLRPTMVRKLELGNRRGYRKALEGYEESHSKSASPCLCRPPASTPTRSLLHAVYILVLSVRRQEGRQRRRTGNKARNTPQPVSREEEVDIINTRTHLLLVTKYCGSCARTCRYYWCTTSQSICACLF